MIQPLNTRFDNNSGATDATLYWAAVRGMLRHISPPGDPDRATIWPPENYQQVAQALRGIRLSAGIRSNFNRNDASLTVTEVLPNSPADGLLQAHDRILRINRQRLENLSIRDIDRLLQGGAGDRVQLTVVRDIHVLNIELTLESFKTKNLTTARLPRSVGYVAVDKLIQHTAANLRDQLSSPPLADVDKLVVDLRGNSGGVFNEELKLAELFLSKDKQILHTLRRGDKIQTFVSSNKSPFEHRLVVLVDKATASASEIFAAALHANGRALIVGTPTFGKATVEQTFTLRNEFRVKFVVGALYEPGGQSWYETGLKPDFLVEAGSGKVEHRSDLTVDQWMQQDPQLRAAWQLLR